jgi:hypothetical protein
MARLHAAADFFGEAAGVFRRRAACIRQTGCCVSGRSPYLPNRARISNDQSWGGIVGSLRGARPQPLLLTASAWSVGRVWRRSLSGLASALTLQRDHAAVAALRKRRGTRSDFYQCLRCQAGFRSDGIVSCVSARLARPPCARRRGAVAGWSGTVPFRSESRGPGA